MNNRFYLRVWGKCAHFQMPECKADGFTYPFVTPSAARGLVESISYKPTAYLDVRHIRVLNPIRYNRMKLNYLPSVPTLGTPNHFENANQVSTVVLEHVEYVIGLDIRLCRRTEGGEIVEFDVPPTDDNNVAKHRDMLRRRVSSGKFFRRPFLGTSKYLAHFKPGHGDERTSGESLLVGTMLHGIEYRDWMSNVAHFFHAHMRDGVVEVPSFFDVLKERATP